jgi:hypothetical protein
MTTETQAVPQTPQHSQLMQRLSGLEAALVATDPEIKSHMKEIHKLLITYEELVHLLSDEEIGKIMGAQQALTNTMLVGSITASSKKAAVGKKAAGLGMGDL